MGFCTGFCKCFGETLIIILNTATILVGVVTVVVGTLLTLFWYLPIIRDMVMTFLQQNIDTGSLNLEELLYELSRIAWIVGIVVTSVGGAILLMGIIGCCSASCHSGCLMGAYSVFLGIVSVAMLSGTIAIAFDNTIVLTPLEYWMYEEVQREFTDPLNNQTTVVGVAASATMVALQCCGVRDYTEFQTCAMWNRNYTYNGYVIYADVPTACCKFNDQWNTTELTESNCLDSPNAVNANINTACFNEIKVYLEIGLAWALGTLGVISGLLCLLFVYTLVLIYIYTKRKVKREYKEAEQLYQYPDIAYAKF